MLVPESWYLSLADAFIGKASKQKVFQLPKGLVRKVAGKARLVSETPIERIYRRETGEYMPADIRRILL